MKICIFGTGYVGLVTGACFAEAGHTLWCVDVDGEKIAALQAGVLPIYEPGLEEIVAANVRSGRLTFTGDIKLALKDALMCFITVGTPPDAQGAADLSQIIGAAQMIGGNMQHYMIIINKSTVPVGTAEIVRATIAQEVARRKLDLDFDVVSNPEFLKEGTAIDDFRRPDRVVIGTGSMHVAEQIKQLYEPFAPAEHVLIMDVKSAEITKYAANVMLATRISFMNEIARLCDKAGGDVVNVSRGIGMDRRIGMKFLSAGAGYGGSCFPKDVNELINTGRKYGLDMKLAAASAKVNQEQKNYLVEMLEKKYNGQLAGKLFGVWGLAFKPQTSDIRYAPAVDIIRALLRRGAEVAVYDPKAMPQAEKAFAGEAGHLYYAENALAALNGADALILMTEWRQFKQPDFTEIKRRLKAPVVFDGRNQYDPKRMRELGFEYYCIGRGCCGL